MSRNRKKSNADTHNTPKPVQESAEQIAVSVRLPGRLATVGRSCAKTSGISLNALICVALSDYLQNKGFRIHQV